MLLRRIFLASTFFSCDILVIGEDTCSASSAAATTSSVPFVVKEEEDEIGYHMSLVADPIPIHSSQSAYQKIEMYQSEPYGKILILDDCIQLTERDASHYNEMMAHVGVMAHPNPKRVLVIGGGDGYVVHEVLKHTSIERVDHVELDREVIDVSRRYLPWGSAWDDDRVHLHIADGADFVRRRGSLESGSYYDVIIQDSSDPFYEDSAGGMVVLPSSVLYTEEHFGNVRRLLGEDGAFVVQAETYNVPSSLDAIKSWHELLLNVGFESAKYGTIAIPSYPTGQIGFFLCTKMESKARSSSRAQNVLPEYAAPEIALQSRFEAMDGEETFYYHPRLQQSCFDLPLWVEKRIYG
eukprot:CAMPEP_0178658566 /NCGR_PEP_ID=MMETSP0698-20121128/26061_1 /TAXON_ID=265572 /ORGANISM="Extubocellulus spinifer, Strain CCMP396" /LENGTH=351 /DNA_ID=CAMNT_0020300967 /DNA_START=159 /DNA_END=1210 /DNA_ORIENTATION=-